MAIVREISFPLLNPIFRGKMNLHLRSTLKNNAALGIRIIAGFLLIAYSSVFLFPPGILPHHEHDHVEHGIDTCEKDPCHISIYHHGYAGGCSHKYHFTSNYEKCVWCDVILAYQMIHNHAEGRYHEINFSSVECEFVQTTDLLIPFSHSGRGPPFFIMS